MPGDVVVAVDGGGLAFEASGSVVSSSTADEAVGMVVVAGADVEPAHAVAARVSKPRRVPRTRWLGEVFMLSTMRRPPRCGVGREVLAGHPKVVASHDMRWM
jgi:hypothetical protein